MTMHEMMNGNGVNETAGRQPETVLTLFETAEELQTKVLLRRMEEALRRRRPRRGNDTDYADFDYDDIVEQSFPASDPPPLP